ncbi:pantoate--beta-alanine ligase [Trueperella bialowiezensis]|uniref:Pantothenate synthetase n=1 Tax=Trueperella bialowiezensis TaxID=312285 RepID=A0A3S5EW44_9ACTO|nr:pantoate--beta-alanine ligase [Trueperella bialowiezensis]VEI13664.1 Pantothenate synthetase [Trueperella bialowiezensis]
MKVCSTRAQLAEALAASEGSRSLVMTMGALHDGHAQLLKAGRAAADVLVASVYVNPLQFGPNEDFERYPRPVEADLAVLEREGVDIAFLPTDGEVYPREPLVRIDPGPVATILEGATRPGHFAGVLQIVHKVFNLVRPDVTFFGQKDAQQLALVKTMVADLNMDVDVRAVPIKRDADGLALSSRNAYLSASEREQALALPRALQAGMDAARGGAAAGEVLAVAHDALAAAEGVTVDYVRLVDPETFVDLEAAATGKGLLVAAIYVGPTRLIDNMEVTVQ